MATNAELDKKVDSVQKSLSEMEGVIRRLVQENNGLLAMLNKTNEEAGKLSAKVANLEAAIQRVATAKPSAASVSKY